MRVNVALLTEEEPKDVEIPKKQAKTQKPEVLTEDDEDNEIDESNSHSKIKTFLLVAAMVGGFGLFVWNMTSLVNNMRLSGQGQAVSAAYDISLEDFTDDDFGYLDDAAEMSDTHDDAADAAGRDSPGDRAAPEQENDLSGETEETAHMEDVAQEADTDNSEWKEKARAAEEKAMMTELELKHAEDMLDSVLTENANLKSQLGAAGGN